MAAIDNGENDPKHSNVHPISHNTDSKTDLKGDAPLEEKKEDAEAPTATRNDLQFGRRLFHFTTGTTVATLYALFLSHHHLVYVLGTVASVLYLFEQVRISYPELASKMTRLSGLFLRAEEQLKESASVPYAMGLLLTILTFPKTPALIGIYTLAIADPLAAIIGIRFGRQKTIKGKTVEGSIAFFAATSACVLVVLSIVSSGAPVLSALGASLLVGFLACIFETLPLRIDDNLTIPLYTAVVAWFTCLLFGIPVL